MEASEAIRVRRSVRSYKSKTIPSATIRRILEAGRLAPSAKNYQPWRFIVVQDPAIREAISKTGIYAGFLTESPLAVVGCGDKATSPKWYAVDVAIALENMVIAATAEGLGTCWVGSFDEAKVKALLNVPENFAIVAILAVGYPKDPERRMPRIRKELSEIAMREAFGKPLDRVTARGRYNFLKTRH